MPSIPTQINTGRTGLDGMSKALARMCIIDAKYDAKARAALSTLLSLTLLTQADYDLAILLLDNVRAYCRIFRAASDVVGFYIP